MEKDEGTSMEPESPFEKLDDDEPNHLRLSLGNESLDGQKEEDDVMEISKSCFVNPNELTDRVKALAPTLNSIPELTLDEMDHVRKQFSQVMGERENITNSLELRVLLADLGLYPPERELRLLLQAYRFKVNISGLIRFLRFYKKDYPTLEVAGPKPDGDVFAQLTKKPTRRDPDAIRAFAALGGEEDGSGTIKVATLTEALSDFGVAVNYPENMVEREVIDLDEFCDLWHPDGETRQGGMEGIVPFMDRSETSFATLDPATPGPQSLMLSFRMSGVLPRHLLGRLGNRLDRNTSLSQPPQGHTRRGPSSTPRKARSVSSNLESTESGPHTPTIPAAATLRNDPLTENERAQLLCQYLTPEKYESRRTRFTLPEKNQNNPVGVGTNNPAKVPSAFPRHPRGEGAGRRKADAKKKQLGWKTSSYGQKKDEESDEDDFLTQKNGGVYRPPSPTILSLRHSTAYKRHQRQQDLRRQKVDGEGSPNNTIGTQGGDGYY